MLNIGLWELLVIVVAGLVFVGPERLPNVMRFMGRSYAKIRHASRDLRMAFQQEVDRVDNERRAEEIARRRQALKQRRLEEEHATVSAVDPHSPAPQPESVIASSTGGDEE